MYPGDDKPFVELAAPVVFTLNPQTGAITAQVELTKNPFHTDFPMLYWTWDAVSGTLTIGQERHQRRHHRHQRQVHGLHPAVAHRRQRCRAQAIKHIAFKMSGGGGKIAADSFASWFENYTALIDFDSTACPSD